MKKKNNFILRIKQDPDGVRKRATTAVKKIVTEKGYEHTDIARLCDTTVASLLNDASPKLKRQQLKALSTHFGVSMLWMISGHGPEWIDTKEGHTTELI